MSKKKSLRHFSDLTEDEVMNMSYKMEMAAIDYAKKIGMSGLSHNGFHNIYTMCQEGMRAEWKKSRAAMKKWTKNGKYQLL
jgi:hypothetical protein